MRAYQQICQLILSICLISSLIGCVSRDTSFEWLDISAIPIANTNIVFEDGDDYEDLASSYINLKHQCRATNAGIDELQRAQDGIKALK